MAQWYMNSTLSWCTMEELQAAIIMHTSNLTRMISGTVSMTTASRRSMCWNWKNHMEGWELPMHMHSITSWFSRIPRLHAPGQIILKEWLKRKWPLTSKGNRRNYSNYKI